MAGEKRIIKEEDILDSNNLLAEIKELREKMNLIEESFQKVSTYQKKIKELAIQQANLVPVHVLIPIFF